jgi:arylsulfatase A-like enzyme
VLRALSSLLVAVLALTSCARAPADRPRNAVVILLDTVRADHVSSYGYERKTTPAIDAFAGQGIVFETTVSSAPWTKPSICSLLDARQPGHAVGKDGNLTRSLVEAFRAAGIRTAAFTEGGFFSRFFAMDRGFAHFAEEEGPIQLARPGQPLQPNREPAGGIERTFAQARAWIGENGDEPFFAVIHTYEPHTPYTHDELARGLSPGGLRAPFTLDVVRRLQSGERVLTAAETEYVAALYDSDLANADRYVGEFLKFLDERGLARDTLVVVTSDHGEELGEHDPAYIGDHGHSLFDTLLRVPLILRDPTLAAAPARIATQVRLVDVLPTIADRMGVPIEVPVHGASLLPLIEGRETLDRPALIGWNSKGPPLLGLREGGYKYVARIPGAPGAGAQKRQPACQLYDLKADPAERENLCATHAKLVAALQATLNEHSAGLDLRQDLPGAEKVDERLVERLRSLGYVE